MESKKNSLFILKKHVRSVSALKKRIVSAQTYYKVEKIVGMSFDGFSFILALSSAWKRNDVSVFSGIYRWWNCLIQKFFLRIFKRFKCKWIYFEWKSSGAFKWDCLYTFFCWYSKANRFLLCWFFIENVGSWVRKIMFRSFSFALFELGP